MKPKLHLMVRYGSSLCFVLLALLAYQSLGTLVGGQMPTFITFYPAVMLVALLAGLGPGLAATVIAALVVDYCIFAPVGHFTIASLRDTFALALFTGMGVFMSVVAELYRRARRQAVAVLVESQERLRGLVQIRTEELAQANVELRQEIAEHHLAREALSQSHQVLEERVAQRTAELETRNAQLVIEADERRKAEAALSRSEQRYRAVVEDQTELIGRYRPDGSYTFVNEAFCRFSGLIHEEVLGRNWQPGVVAEDLPLIEERLQLMSPENPVVVIENRIISGGGDIRWMQFVNRGFFDPHGQLVETQAVGRDITERKQLEETLRVSENKLRIIFENEIYAICIFDFESGEILDVNQTHVSMYGYSREELCSAGMTAFDLSAEVEMSKSSLRHLSQTSTSFISLRWHRKKDGTVFPVEVVGGAYLWNGRKVMFGLVHDITERKQTEETVNRYARRLIVLEEDLRKRIAMELHDDVGQVLTALGFDLAHISNHLPEDAGHGLRSTLDDSRGLTKEISRKVRNLMADLRPLQLDEYGLATAVRAYADHYMTRTGIAITVQVDPRLPRLEIKRELALFRITQEALNNVAKHAAADHVSVSLDFDGASIWLLISDDGKGFVPGKISAPDTGSGWGVTIMRERAELAGGTLRLDTVLGAGTTIMVEIKGGFPNVD